MPSELSTSSLNARRGIAAMAAIALALTNCVSESAPAPDGNVGVEAQEIVVCPAGPTVPGIDVSEWQGAIDWSAVAASGRAFAITRVGDGTYKDPYFDGNWAAIKANGMVRGAYLFYEPSVDPIAQANLVIASVGVLGPGDLPVTLDVEKGAPNAGGVGAWINAVAQGTGKPPMIYTAPGFWNQYFSGQFGNITLWVANWGVACPSTPDSWSSWVFWQPGGGGVPGIGGNVDQDVFNGSLDQLHAFAGGGGCSPEVCNGKDDNCNGLIDEDLSEQCGSNVGVCKFGQSACSAGAWGACLGGVGPSDEICDGLDNDCNGLVDDHDVCELDEAIEAPLFDLGPASDVDGDGRADVCALSDAGIVCELSSGHGFDHATSAPLSGFDPSARSVYSTLRVGDIDGDGHADACLREPSGVSCWISEGHGLGRRVVGPPLGDDAGFGAPAPYSTIRMADIDGDGRSDLCARSATGFTCYRATGDGFTQTPTLSALSDAAGFSDVNRYATLRMGDIDGDGRADVCARGKDGISCFLSNGNGFSSQIVGPVWSDAAGFSAWQRWSTIRMADIDGDGRADLCAREPDGFNCYLSRGQGFGDEVTGPVLDDASGWSQRDRFGSIRMGDLDGDGAADLCARGPGEVTCWLWSGHGFDRMVHGPELSDDSDWAHPDLYRTMRLADIDGDGRGDLCARGANGFDCWLFDGGAFERLILGPAWTDQNGWSAPSRFETIRLSSGSTSAPTLNAPPKSKANGEGSAPGISCSTQPPVGSTHFEALFVAIALSWLAARRRASSLERL